MNLLGTDDVHLLTNDLFDLAEHTQAQRQPGVDTGGSPADITGADEEFMRSHLGVDRILTKGFEKQCGRSEHRTSLWGGEPADDSPGREPGKDFATREAKGILDFVIEGGLLRVWLASGLVGRRLAGKGIDHHESVFGGVQG
jgi:hypothetical protein